MEPGTADLIEELELDALQLRIDDLVRTVHALREENRALRARQANLLEERAALLDRNQTVRLRVESIVSRLKEMEQEA